MRAEPGEGTAGARDGSGLYYDEFNAAKGSLGLLRGDGVMRTLFGQ